MIQISLSQAIEALIRAKVAAGLSPHTIRNYRVSFQKLQLYLENDPPLPSITKADLVGFFYWLREEYESEPDGVAPRGKFKLSEKTRRNIHTDLSALWSWAREEHIVSENIVHDVPAPENQPPVIEPFSQAEIELLLGVCAEKRSWKTMQRTPTANELARPTADRDRALILLLLDTGVRASELCGIRMDDVDMAQHSIRVLGKGSKERLVFFGKRTSKALWRYIAHRADGEFLFSVGPAGDERPLTRSVLLKLIYRLAEKAGVKDANLHKFRHTFAITFLRGGGDLLALQMLLGHSDLKMVQRYARIVAADCQRAHERASPVDNWKL